MYGLAYPLGAVMTLVMVARSTARGGLREWCGEDGNTRESKGVEERSKGVEEGSD